MGFIDLMKMTLLEALFCNFVLVFITQKIMEHFFSRDRGRLEGAPHSDCQHDMLGAVGGRSDVNRVFDANSEMFLEVMEGRCAEFVSY